MMLSDYFQLGPVQGNVMHGHYDWKLVLLSYLVAAFASYVALDMAGRLRDENNTLTATLCWLFGGGFAMGAGIWSMHFIGMLAFQMAMPMTFNLFWTIISMVVAVVASLIALSLLIPKNAPKEFLIAGGLILGIAIAAMHYTGMYAMTDTMIIRYSVGYYILSIIIALVAAEAALWLAIKSNRGVLKTKIRLKIFSALVMGAAICGMHYTGMVAANFYSKAEVLHGDLIDHTVLSISIAALTFVVLGIAFVLSTYKEITNQQIVMTARLTGMAEVSSNVLHSVGNVLNSLNVSILSIESHLSNNKLSKLINLIDLLKTHKDNLATYLSTENNAANIINYLEKVTEHLNNDHQHFAAEINSILNNIKHISDIINTQQSLQKFVTLKQVVDINEVMTEAINLSGISLSHTQFNVIKEMKILKPQLMDKIKLLQILVNILKNAKEAVLNTPEKTIKIRVDCFNKNTLSIEVIDSGVGINPDEIKSIFRHGYSTKETGHGFGLHSSAILAKQMGGSLTAKSDGIGKGAHFTLLLPYEL